MNNERILEALREEYVNFRKENPNITFEEQAEWWVNRLTSELEAKDKSWHISVDGKCLCEKGGSCADVLEANKESDE